VIRHFKRLVEIFPSSFRFNSKAGSWSLDPNILNVDDAITFLTAALYHNASHDPEATEELKLIAHRDLARAYALQGDFVSAQKEYFHLLQLTPTDFGIAFHLRQVTSQVRPSPSISSISMSLICSRFQVLLVSPQRRSSQFSESLRRSMTRSHAILTSTTLGSYQVPPPPPHGCLKNCFLSQLKMSSFILSKLVSPSSSVALSSLNKRGVLTLSTHYWIGRPSLGFTTRAISSRESIQLRTPMMMISPSWLREDTGLHQPPRTLLLLLPVRDCLASVSMSIALTLLSLISLRTTTVKGLTHLPTPRRLIHSAPSE
jgi:hypothetical protein